MGQYKTVCTIEDFHQDTIKLFNGKRIAVTGGSGFIGSHLVEQLLLMGARAVVITRQEMSPFLRPVIDKIEVINCDLNDYSATLRAFEGCEMVLNLAAMVGGIEYNMKHPASIFQANMITYINVMKAALEQKVERVLVTSSACVYPRFCTIPTPEDEGMKEGPEPTNDGYGWSKRMQEFLGIKYSEEFGMKVAIARPYNCYGPRDNFNPNSSHVIPALILKALTTKETEFEVWGDGANSRSFLYVDDFARGLLEIASRYAVADPLNVGANEEITMKQAAILISSIASKKLGKDIRPKFDPTKVTGQPRRKCDNTKLIEKLNFTPNISFEEGIERTINWVLENENSPLSTYS